MSGNVKQARNNNQLLKEVLREGVASHTSDEVPQVEAFVSFDALVGDLACVVNAERQADEREAHGYQQEEDHHHVKAAV